jgi:rare lipoprotein A
MDLMNFRYALALSIMILFLNESCSRQTIREPVSSPTKVPEAPPPSPPKEIKKTDRLERPYAVNGKWYFPVSSVAQYQEKGICSWYGPDFHGKKTSTGEVYDMHAYTAAHRILPFNTQVRVRNPANNKEVVVRINDRGPFMKDRILDLSYSGAKALGLVGPGTAPIELEALGILEEREEDGQKVSRLVQQVDFRQGDFSIQIGAFKDRQNALRLQERLSKEYSRIEVSETVLNGETFFRVRISHCQKLQEALQLQKQLEGQGFSQAMVVAN